MKTEAEFNLSCPSPVPQNATIQMSHGGGGRKTHDLFEKIFLKAFRNAKLEERHDGALLDVNGQRLAFTTDSYVVRPLFFPGGDIGKLAVCGTVNDLLMCGARPLYLSCGFILEEGLPVETLERVAESMRLAAAEAGVELVTGDTKVVDHGKADGLYINTAGIGSIETASPVSPVSVRPGDQILLSGDVGRHGMAILAVREGLSFETTLESDCAPLTSPVLELIRAGIPVHCLRDLTRGGLATAVIEIAETSRFGARLDEEAVPVCDEVRGSCEILGLDPLYVANEGRFIAYIPREAADAALKILRRHHPQACRIGEVAAGAGPVLLKNPIGVERILDRLSGEQLPRIC